MQTHIPPAAEYRRAALVHPPFHDAEDDEMPPELFDEDEDREDLTAYIHIAELSLQE